MAQFCFITFPNLSLYKTGISAVSKQRNSCFEIFRSSSNKVILVGLRTMMMIIVLCALFGLSQQASLHGSNHHEQPSNWTKPWFCHKLDCPVYTVLETNDKFETRRYVVSEWVATNISVIEYTKDQETAMFDKLFAYIAGNNSNHQKIPMTAPVLTQIVHGAGPDCESNFTMDFMIPHDLQPTPPTPLEKGVYIRMLQELTVYVKQYPGFDSQEKRQEMVDELNKDLKAAGKSYDGSVYYTAGYDGPYTIVNRHNEIWVVPKSSNRT